MTTDITPYAAAPLTERMEYARILSGAADLIPRALFGPPIDGRLPAPSPGKVLLVMETGAMLNLHPIAALSGINVIEGKPAASAALISAVVRNAGHTLRVTSTGTIEGGDYAARATLIRHDDADNPFESVWTPQRAARAGLCAYSATDGVWTVRARSQGGKPLPWEAYTESLCKARAVTEVARDGAQDALFGVRYTPEELGAPVDERGEVIEGEVVEDYKPEPTAAPAPRKRATRGTQGTKRTQPVPEDAEVVVEPVEEGDASYTVADAEGTAEHDAATHEVIPGSEIPGEPATNLKLARNADALPDETEVAYQWRKDRERKAADEAQRKAEATAALVEQAKADGAATRAAREEAEAAPNDPEEIERQERARFAEEQMEQARKADEAEQERADAAVRHAAIADQVQEVPLFNGGAEERTYEQRVNEAGNLAELKAVWDEAGQVGGLTTELRLSIVERKNAMEAAAETFPA